MEIESTMSQGTTITLVLPSSRAAQRDPDMTHSTATI
jgi:hypothetical protein